MSGGPVRAARNAGAVPVKLEPSGQQPEAGCSDGRDHGQKHAETPRVPTIVIGGTTDRHAAVPRRAFGAG